MNQPGEYRTSNIFVAPAQPRHAHVIADLWRDASQWLQGKGIDQWQYEPSHKKISDDIDRGVAYMVKQSTSHWVEGRPGSFSVTTNYLGTVSMDHLPDPEFWEADDQQGNALYIRRLIVNSKMRGKGVGESVLDCASWKARRDRKILIRLDSWKGNTKLSRFYLRSGFSHVKTANLPHRKSGVLFEKDVSSVRLDVLPRFSLVERPIADNDGNSGEDYGRTAA